MTTEAAGEPAPGAAKSPGTLDDVMIAMDVVDTVRHREDLVRRELNEAGREADLIARLREIYRQQGIEVPDHVLAEGVKALRESRFTYTPPPKGLKRTLLTLWTRRRTVGIGAGAAAAAVVGYQLAIALPAREEARRQETEITVTLPKALKDAYADVLAVSTDPGAKGRADALLADGERALRERSAAAARESNARLKALRDELAQEYTLTIVARKGEAMGVWRTPPKSQTGRNYYLIVEAITPDGRALPLPVRNEETGKTETVTKLGVRVPEATFSAAAADRRDDGIVQNNRFAIKRRGVLAVEYLMPFEGGMITAW
ncbi:MAG TPA: DUF6384 family protein [Hyphomicrobiaceae bacterium]|nr:DUF6384 family protein [Hyphomicrobiaceae bacterium]